MDFTPELAPQASVSPDAGRDATIVFGNQANIQGSVAGRDLHIQQAPTEPISLKDVFRCLTTMLEARYRSIKIPKMPWIDYNQELPLEHYYVDLTVTEKNDFLQRVIAKEVQLQDIFKPNGSRRPTRILVEGPGGYGKSMLSLKLCYDYFKRETYLHGYELVILIHLRDYKGSTLHQMLEKKLTLQDYATSTIFMAVRKHQKSVLIILDGYDESDENTRENLNLLLKSEYLPEATVVVTSRPDAVNTMDYFDKMIEIKGLNGAKRTQFLQLHLKSCSEEQKMFLREYLYTKFNVSFGDESILTRLSRGLKTLFRKEKENLFACPLFLLLVVVVIKSSYPNVTSFRTKTDLYRILFNFVVQRTFKERLGSEETVDLFEFNGENPPSYVRSLRQFGKLALDKLKAKEFAFTKEEITSHCDDDVILQMGLLTENDCGDVAEHQTFWFQPIHLSILEFCVAYYLVYCFKCYPTAFIFPEPFLLDRSGKIKTFVLPFFVGLCGEMLPFLFQHLPSDFLFLEHVEGLANCESVITESVIDVSSLRKFLPRIDFAVLRDLNSPLRELIKVIVAESIRRNKVECIIFDSDLDRDICMGKERLCVPLIVLYNDCDIQFFRNIHAFEIRVVLKDIKHVERLPALAKLAKAYVISLVKPKDGYDLSWVSLFNTEFPNEVFVLNETWFGIEVKRVKGVGRDMFGKSIEIHTPLYKTKIVERATVSDEPSCNSTHLQESTMEAASIVKAGCYSFDNMNVKDLLWTHGKKVTRFGRY